jgi:hypothetical protein
MNLFVGQLTPQQKADPVVRHALGVQRALSMGNYHALFGLYLNAPNMGAYIMDHFIDRERIKALMVIAKAWVSLIFHRLSVNLQRNTDIEQCPSPLFRTSWRLIRSQLRVNVLSFTPLGFSSIPTNPTSPRFSIADLLGPSLRRCSKKNIAKFSSRVQYRTPHT